MFPRRMRPVLALACAMAVLASLPAHGAQAGNSPALFRTDVLAVLSKAGCNAGPCHGNASGKGGLKLSLRGEDPARDLDALTQDYAGRRVSPNDPERSLLLLKATTQLAHEGGRRFDRASPEYEILRSWIASGAGDSPANAPELTELRVEPAQAYLVAPARDIALRVIARFSDGSERDVSRLAVYEPTLATAQVSPEGRVTAPAPSEVTVLVRYLNRQQPVRLAFIPETPGYAWKPQPERTYIDRHVFSKLRTLRLNLAPEVSDAVFLRRASFDLLGLPPDPAEARAFLADRRPNKRARWVDAALQRPEFAEFWALKWSDLLRNEEKSLDRKGVELFHRWIRDGIAQGKPVDQFARELLVARGSTYENPAANFYRSHRQVNTRAETVAQVFLGTRLLCAQCHNHPFDRWTQADYFDWAGLFSRVQYRVLENRYPDSLDKHGFTGEQVVYIAAAGETQNPNTRKEATPRFLGSLSAVDPGTDRLKALADWLTSPTHPLFARVQANRIWYHLMGRGLVDPVDDFRATNPPSHPELLDELTADFVRHRFDLRHLIRTFMNSRTYQAGVDADAGSAHDEVNYSHTVLRRLGAEQILDAISGVTGAPLSFNGYPEGMRAGQIPGVPTVMVRRKQPGEGEQFLKVFGKPERLLASEEERSCQTTLGQAFQLMTGPAISELLLHPGNRIDRLLGSGRELAQGIEELYWAALTRAPTPAELQAMTTHVNQAASRRAGLEDVAWALMNSKEFVMRY